MKPSPRRSFIPLHRPSGPEIAIGIVAMMSWAVAFAEWFSI